MLDHELLKERDPGRRSTIECCLAEFWTHQRFEARFRGIADGSAGQDEHAQHDAGGGTDQGAAPRFFFVGRVGAACGFSAKAWPITSPLERRRAHRLPAQILPAA